MTVKKRRHEDDMSPGGGYREGRPVRECLVEMAGSDHLDEKTREHAKELLGAAAETPTTSDDK